MFLSAALSRHGRFRLNGNLHVELRHESNIRPTTPGVKSEARPSLTGGAAQTRHIDHTRAPRNSIVTLRHSLANPTCPGATRHRRSRKPRFSISRLSPALAFPTRLTAAHEGLQ